MRLIRNAARVLVAVAAVYAWAFLIVPQISNHQVVMFALGYPFGAGISALLIYSWEGKEC